MSGPQASGYRAHRQPRSVARSADLSAKLSGTVYRVRWSDWLGG